MRGQEAREKDELNVDSNSRRTKRLNDLRIEVGMLPGPAALFDFIFLMADNNLAI